MFYQISLSPQVKRWAIITYKPGIYELPHELLNYLRLLDLRKLGNIRKLSKLHKLSKTLLALAKKSRKIVIKPFPRCVPLHEN